MSHSRETDFRVRRRDVVGHRSTVSEEEVTIHQGIRLTSAARTWCDLAAFCGVDDLVVAGDHLVRIPNRRYERRAAPYCSLAQLRAAVEGRRGFRGRPRAVAALTMIRVGADSLPETKLRLKLVGSGLPEPVLQVPPTPGAPRGVPRGYGIPAVENCDSVRRRGPLQSAAGSGGSASRQRIPCPGLASVALQSGGLPGRISRGGSADRGRDQVAGTGLIMEWSMCCVSRDLKRSKLTTLAGASG